MPSLSTIVDQMRHRASVNKIYKRIPDANILNHSTSSAIVANECYLEIRLCEMHLKDAREWARTFLPMAVFVTELGSPEQRNALPILVSNSNRLQSISKLIDGQSVEYKGITLMGPVPYFGGDIGLFIGLFRAEANDWSMAFLQLVGDLVDTLDVSRTSSYLNLASPLTKGIKSLLGMRDIEMRVGMETTLTPSKTEMFKSGYFVLMNAPEESLNKPLWVRDGALFKGTDSMQLERIKDADYCLCELVCTTSRNDYEQLPFHSIWIEIEKLIWSEFSQTERDKAITRARMRFPELAQAIVGSPDLTRTQKRQLIQVYKLDFESALELTATTYRSTQIGVSAARGKEGLDASIRALAGRDEFAAARFTLANLARNVDQLHPTNDLVQLRNLSQGHIAWQLNKLTQLEMGVGCPPKEFQDPDPQLLADAMTYALINPKETSKAAGKGF